MSKKNEIVIEFVIFSILLFLAGLRYLYLYIISKNDKNIKIKGIITHFETRGRIPRGKLLYPVAFEYNNKKYERKVDSFHKAHREGDEVTVIVNPDNIDKKMIVLVVDDCKLIFPVILLTIASLFAVVTILLIKNM